MPAARGTSQRRGTGKRNGASNNNNDDATLTQAAVSRVEDLLDRRGVNGGRGRTPSTSAPGRPKPSTRKPTEKSTGAVSKPKHAAKQKASAHNAKLLAAASLATDLSTNSGKANAKDKSKDLSKVSNALIQASKGSRQRGIDRNELGECGALATRTGEGLDKTVVARLAVDANMAAVAAAAERKRKRCDKSVDGEVVEIDDSDSDNSITDTDEWEDVGGAADEYANTREVEDFEIEEEVANEDLGGTSRTARRISAAHRTQLEELHKTHLLCLIARGRSTNEAASDDLVQTLCTSLAPRELFTDAQLAAHPEKLSDTDGLPTIAQVARLAKWFTGVFETIATEVTGNTFTGNKRGNVRGIGFSQNSKPKNCKGKTALASVSKFARVKVVDDVIVLDDDDGVFIVEDGDVSMEPKHTGDESEKTFGAASCSALRAAVIACTVSAKTRLLFACARKKGTQEDTCALFVAATRGLGYVARLVTGFDPVQFKAGVSVLEKTGVVRFDDDAKKKTKKSKDDPPTKYPYLTSTLSDVSTEPVTHWCDVLTKCEDINTGGYETRWVPVVPHCAGCPKSQKRWSFQAGGASVDDIPEIIDKSDSVLAPYVLAFRGVTSIPNSDSPCSTPLSFTDVTRKYAAAFSKRAEKRCDNLWVEKICEIGKRVDKQSEKDPFFGVKDIRAQQMTRHICSADAHDTKEMEKLAKRERLPQTLTEIKNHPLYVIESNLKQNEIIYPRQGKMLGFIHGECVFSKDCVSTLRSVERWKTEEQREVLTGELGKPIAFVHSKGSRQKIAFEKKRVEIERVDKEKAKNDELVRMQNPSAPKFAPRRKGPRSVEEVARGGGKKAVSNKSEEKNVDKLDEPKGDIALYGVWQTTTWNVSDYLRIGQVPKNERGNVDLIGAKAVPPPGCVHVSLPYISKVARKLRDASVSSKKENQFDYAPALVGFEFRRGGVTTPKFDGVVLLAENEKILRTAWTTEERMRIQSEKEKEKRKADKRWRILLSAIWTRRSLRDEFFENDETDAGVNTNTEKKKTAKKTATLTVTEHQTLTQTQSNLQTGRVAVVVGGAEADVEEM